MYSTADFKKGLKIELDGTPYVIVDFLHVKPGKGGAFVRTKIKNLVTGKVLDQTFRSGERVKRPDLVEREMQFLYREGDTFHLMDNETYEQIVFEGQHCSPAQFDTDGRVISVYSFSKGYAMTGWRVGYLVAPVELIRLMTVLQEPMVSCACSVSQKAAEAALTGPQEVVHSMVASYRQRRDAAVELVRAHGLPVHKPAGAFYMLVDISSAAVQSRAFALSLLQRKRVAVAPGSAFGEVAAQTVRVCLAVEEKALMEGLERLCHYLIEAG